ncbi:hypothetical protein VAEU17_300052 [Vibrio aestuarianus]|nr:hypothetical protein VAEU17_300052 [Vibrio aestuarianus]
MSILIKDQNLYVSQAGLYRFFDFNLLFLFVIAFVLYVSF